MNNKTIQLIQSDIIKKDIFKNNKVYTFLLKAIIMLFFIKVLYLK